MANETQFNGLGRRKTSTARAWMKPGSGKWEVNGRPIDEYFPRSSLVQHVQEPFAATGTQGRFDVKLNLDGGGTTGQAGAARLALARALLKYDAELRPVLREKGMLTRDPREVERKKPGRPGARKRFQFSKR
jgi:small subunit ribosomal protein S9